MGAAGAKGGGGGGRGRWGEPASRADPPRPTTPAGRRGTDLVEGLEEAAGDAGPEVAAELQRQGGRGYFRGAPFPRTPPGLPPRPPPVRHFLLLALAAGSSGFGLSVEAVEGV